MLKNVGVAGGFGDVGVRGREDAAVAPDEQDARRAGHERERVLVDVHDVGRSSRCSRTSGRSTPCRCAVASQTSNVSMKTRSGLFGSTAMPWSYQFCG